MYRTTLIRGGRVVLPSGTVETNLLLRDGKIAAIDADARSAADEVIEAAGLVVFPGAMMTRYIFANLA